MGYYVLGFRIPIELVSSETARVTAGYINRELLLTYKSWIPGPAILDRRPSCFPNAASFEILPMEGGLDSDVERKSLLCETRCQNRIFDPDPDCLGVLRSLYDGRDLAAGERAGCGYGI